MRERDRHEGNTSHSENNSVNHLNRMIWVPDKIWVRIPMEEGVMYVFPSMQNGVRYDRHQYFSSIQQLEIIMCTDPTDGSIIDEPYKVEEYQDSEEVSTAELQDAAGL